MKAAANLVWKGWSMVTYPDQPVWSNTVVTQLVAGKSLSSLLPALGKGLAQNAQAAGYKVVTEVASLSSSARDLGARGGHAQAWPPRPARACRSSCRTCRS